MISVGYTMMLYLTRREAGRRFHVGIGGHHRDTNTHFSHSCVCSSLILQSNSAISTLSRRSGRSLELPRLVQTYCARRLVSGGSRVRAGW